MENDIWNEISSFLNQLRCENINRESYIYFQELAFFNFGIMLVLTSCKSICTHRFVI